MKASGKGAVGFGCGMILALAIGAASMTAWTPEAWVVLGLIALIVGTISALFGEIVLEWILHRARWFI